jgi:transglutaminase-like putative cysteine protease
MRVSIGHVSRYTYSEPTNYSIQTLRLSPPSFAGQRVVEWSVTAPGIETATKFRDAFGNQAHLVTYTKPHTEILIIAKGVVETEDRAGVVLGLTDAAPLRVYLRQTPATTAGAAIRDLAAAANVGGSVEGCHRLMNLVREKVHYQVGVTSEQTTADQAFAAGMGVCQDHAHIYIAALRALGMPARYVNGYMVAPTDEPSEAHHAWAETWIDGLGWVGFDPANRTCPTDQYVRLAAGLDSASAAPIRGTRRGSAHEALDVVVEVQQQGSQQQ